MTFLIIQAKFVFFKIDIKFFFIDLRIIVTSIFYVHDLALFEFLSADSQMVLACQFIFEVNQTFMSLI